MRYHTLLFMGCLLSGLNGLSQSNYSQVKVDSIRQEIESCQTDSCRIPNLQALSMILYGNRPAEHWDVCQRIDSLSRHLLKDPLDDSMHVYYQRIRAKALSDLGNNAYFHGDIPSALKYHHKSLEVSRVLNDSDRIAATLSNLGVNYKNQGYYDRAMPYHSEAHHIYTKLGNQKGVAITANNMGLIYNILGDFRASEKYYQKSLKIFRDMGYDLAVSTTLNNVALTYKARGDYPTALNYIRKSLQLSSSIHDTIGVRYAYRNLGDIFELTGEYDSAFHYLNKALQLQHAHQNKKGIASVLNEIGLLFVDMGEIDSAEYYFKKSMPYREETGDIKGLGISYNNLGGVYMKRGNAKSAIDYYLKAYAIAEELNVPYDIRQSSRSLYDAYKATDSITKAKKFLSILLEDRQRELKYNFPVLPEREKELYLLKMKQDFDRLFDFAAELNNSSPEMNKMAYNHMLQLKGLLLRSSATMRDVILKSDDSTLINQYNAWLSKKRQIAKAYSSGESTDSLEIEANQMESYLANNSVEFKASQNLYSKTWKEVEQSLAEGETVIETLRFPRFNAEKEDPETQYGALVLHAGSTAPKYIALSTGKELKEQLGAFPGNDQLYIQKLYGTRENPVMGLYEKAWAPLSGELKSSEIVHFSPVGLLNKISFAAIVDEENRYLSDKYSLQIKSTSAELIDRRDNSSITGTDVVLFGGIYYTDSLDNKKVWPYLPGTLDEVDDIHQKLQGEGWSSALYKGYEATEERFKQEAPGNNIIHIASHGFFYPDPDMEDAAMNSEVLFEEDLAFRGGTSRGMELFVHNENPMMRSGLVFAGANSIWGDTLNNGRTSNEGVLTAQEVATLDFRGTDLVILSACETGLGEIRGVEGVYGLQRSFKMAGAKKLIISLWQVPDQQTQEFMSLLYANLIEENDISNAFQLTQKKMREKYAPYYWAAFILLE